MDELLALIPDREKFKQIRKTKDSFFDEETYDGFDEEMKVGLEKLREATDGCPACMLAAIRQKKIPVPVVIGFDYAKELSDFWKNYNRENIDYY
jgi:hypothetical protein